MSCNLSKLRKQLDEMQTIMDSYNRCHEDDDKTTFASYEKVIIERTKQKCIEAVEKKLMTKGADSVNSDKPFYRNLAIKAIQEVE